MSELGQLNLFEFDEQNEVVGPPTETKTPSAIDHQDEAEEPLPVNQPLLTDINTLMPVGRAPRVPDYLTGS